MFKSFTSSDNKPAATARAKTSAKATANDGKAVKGKPSAPTPTAPTAPASVERAARLMLFGAPASIVFGIYGIIYSLVDKGDIIKTAHYTNGQFTFALVLGFVFSLVYAALWVWMARTNQAGRPWARITASVLFLLWTYQTYRGISGLKTYLDLGALLIMLGIWGIGLGALYYLWRPDSKPYFTRTAR